MTFTVLPRSTIGAPTPPSGRTKLPVPCRHLLVHYTGAGTYGDGRRVDTVEATSIAAYGVNVGKPYEYNYMVGWQGNVYMQAGGYMGQHCLNFNSKSMGVLLILGVGVPLSTAMVDAFREFRQWMVTEGRLAPDHEVVPHYRYRSTMCCAQAAGPRGAKWDSPTGEGHLGNVIAPLLEPWNPSPPEEDDLMPPVYFRNTKNWVAAYDPYSGNVVPVTGTAYYKVLGKRLEDAVLLTDDEWTAMWQSDTAA